MTINQSKIGHFHPDFDNFYPDFYPYRPGRNKRPGSHLTAHPPTLGKSSFYPPRAFARETTVFLGGHIKFEIYPEFSLSVGRDLFVESMDLRLKIYT